MLASWKIIFENVSLLIGEIKQHLVFVFITKRRSRLVLTTGLRRLVTVVLIAVSLQRPFAGSQRSMGTLFRHEPQALKHSQ
jgi:hypothetical protein